MKFELEGDVPAMLQALEKYKSQFEEEYKKQTKNAKETIKSLGLTGSNMLADEFPLFFWEENGKVLIRIPLYMPRIIKIMRGYKKMEKSFMGFFKELGVECKSCKYIGD